MLKRLIPIFVLLLATLVGALWAIQNPRAATLLIPGFDPLSDLTDKVVESNWIKKSLDFSESQVAKNISAPRYLAYDSDAGRVYYASASSTIFAPASFTKLLSMATATDLLPLETPIETDQKAVSMEPTVLGVKLGEKFTLRELIRGSISTSANDAASLVATGTEKHLGLPEGSFVELMNRKARSIGMNSSYFQNSMGYDHPYQYTTLTDLVELVSLITAKYKDIVHAGSSDRDDLLKTDTHGFYYLPNWNGLLGVYPGVYGLKIAYTDLAGYGTIVTYQNKAHSLVVIVSGADSIYERDTSALLLLNSMLNKLGYDAPQVGRTQLKAKYQTWANLAEKIRSELDALQDTAP